MVISTSLLVSVGVPVFTAILAFLGGRKSSAGKSKEHYESLVVELEATKNFRELLISDNNSLIVELKEMKLEMVAMKKQLKELSKFNCLNAVGCPNRK